MRPMMSAAVVPSMVHAAEVPANLRLPAIPSAEPACFARGQVLAFPYVAQDHNCEPNQRHGTDHDELNVHGRSFALARDGRLSSRAHRAPPIA
jgi:hypothetical protein